MMVLALAAAIWGLGHWLGAPKGQRWGALALLWGAGMLAHVTLPDGAALRAQIGGDAQIWAVLGGLVALGAGYGAVLSRLRRRARRAELPAVPTQTGPFGLGELSRYSRHILLREIGGPGQARLKRARVLVVGAGGLGSPALAYLAASGLGTIGVIDPDLVEESNLSRQIIHTAERLGLPKVQSAQIALAQINPHVTVLPYHRALDAGSQGLIAEYDLILDGTDSMATRYLVNQAAVAAGKPLIAAALTQWEGQISLYHPAAGAPCYACIFPQPPAAGLAPPCAEAGVLSPLPGVIGAMIAVEAIKQITGAGQTLAGRMLIYDALDGQWRNISVARNPACPVCGGGAA